MKHSRKVSLLMLGMSLITGLSIFGTTAGTLAWYAFNARVSLSFTGTSVMKSVLLNVGIVDNNDKFTDAKVAALNLERGDPDEEDDNHIVWARSNSGLDSNVIGEYLKNYGFAVTQLSPVTSKARLLSETSNIALYNAPEVGQTVAQQQLSETKNYVQIPLAFKIKNNDDTKIADKEIWLTDTVVQASGQRIDEALRVFVNNSHSKFILNPKIKEGTSTGSTVVGGLLDLDDSKTYDYNKDDKKEIVYGEYSGTPTYSANPYGVEWDSAPYYNVNNMEEDRRVDSTFYAKRDMNAYTVSGVTFNKVAEYETVATIKPSINATTGAYEAGKPIAYTDSTDRIGYVTLTIWIEGWDHAVVNKAVNYSFNLGLKFEVNRT